MKIWFKYFLVVSVVVGFSSKISTQSITWDRLFGDLTGFYRAIETNNGGFVATGTKGYNNNWKFYSQRLNSYGDTLWSFLYNTQDNSVYTSFWIDQTNENGFIMTGQGGPGAFSIAHLVKIDSSGIMEWWKSFAWNKDTRGVFVKQTPDLGYGLLIYAYLSGDILFVKTDSLGNMQWQKIYDSGDGDVPRGFSIMNDSGFFILGGSVNANSIFYMYLLRVDNYGDTVWTKKIGYSNKRTSYNAMDKTSENEIVVGGMSAIGTSHIFDSSLVIKMDTLGNIQWQKKYSAFGREFCSSIADVPGRGIVMAGEAGLNYSGENGMVRLLDYNGNIIFEKFYSYPNSELNVFRSISICSDNGFIISGYVTPIGQNSRAYLLKTDSLGNLVDIQNNFEVVNDYELFQNYPNPFNPSTTISYYIPAAGNVKIAIYDMLGREVAVLVDDRKFAGKHEVQWDASNFSSGVFFYKLETGEFKQTKRMVLIK